MDTRRIAYAISALLALASGGVAAILLLPDAIDWLICLAQILGNGTPLIKMGESLDSGLRYLGVVLAVINLLVFIISVWKLGRLTIPSIILVTVLIGLYILLGLWVVAAFFVVLFMLYVPLL